MSGVVHCRIDDGVMRLTIDHPPVNALNRQAFLTIEEHVRAAESCPEVRVLVLEAAGSKAFAAGIDIREVSGFTADDMAQFGELTRRVLTALETCGKPVVCAVQGPAYGAGFELALACDVRVATEQAVFALPELNLGIIPGGGGTQRLSRLIGLARAKEVVLLGKPLSAQAAKDLGLVWDVVPAERLEECVQVLVAELCKRPAVALAQAKRALLAAWETHLSDGLSVEQEAFMTAFTSEDGREGVAAFAERRSPVFTGR
ncbi:MAG: enoyl-CoA hydratase/isomerase family protein [Alicyclobacillus sp.]|nr:enoyl-CoA hydratase/isomerase family protein [Alicyclobacillus sp.]